jgi:predicted DNA-binding protein
MATHYKVTVKPDQLDQLREFSDETGVPISHCVREALEMYVDSIVPARLEALRKSQNEIRKSVRSAGKTKGKTRSA